MSQNKKLYYVVSGITDEVKTVTIYDIRKDGLNYQPSFRGAINIKIGKISKVEVGKWFKRNGYSKDTETIEL
tara:strand:+ start:10885 stop:11100 length:216 start_codon:yes stop_codon:yes gene_type:complete